MDNSYELGLTNADPMVFDWDEAARIILKRKPKRAFAGLKGLWKFTGGLIYSHGLPVKDEHTYLASIADVPELIVDNEVIPCYRMKHEVPGWDENTKWPESSLEILEDCLSKELITPEEFLRKMKEIFKEGDVVEDHIYADDLMCEVLTRLGYGSGVDVFKNAIKWYE